MANIEILLRSRLVKDLLSSVLLQAGLVICDGPGDRGNETVILIDFDAWKDPEIVHAHQSCGVKIVALKSDADSQEIEPEQVALLSGILTYDLSRAAFVGSLWLICSGERIFPQALAAGQKPPAPLPVAELRAAGVRVSPREKEILCRLAAGHPNKMIAQHLGITEATVKVHLKSVLRKIGAENRTQAAIWALANLPGLSLASRRSDGPSTLGCYRNICG
jgi:two-component system, NarL family, nitrate/nitrite response regulator NarL